MISPRVGMQRMNHLLLLTVDSYQLKLLGGKFEFERGEKMHTALVNLVMSKLAIAINLLAIWCCHNFTD